MNLYQISEELLNLFAEIEENEGELTEELEQRLQITQDDFKDKIKSYVDVIKSTKADINAIDEEIKRISEYKKSKTKLVDRLSSIVASAIDTFGDETKSGGKFIDFGTGKVSVRNSKKVILNDNKVNVISSEFAKAISYEVYMGGASNKENITYEDIISRCAAHVDITKEGEQEENHQKITREDIMNTSVEVTLRDSISNLMNKDGFDMLKKLYEFSPSIKFAPHIDKTKLKDNLAEEDNDITIGDIETSKSLIIK